MTHVFQLNTQLADSLAVAQTRPLSGDISTGPQCRQGAGVGGGRLRGAGRGGPARRGHSELETQSRSIEVLSSRVL